MSTINDVEYEAIKAWLKDRGYIISADETYESLLQMIWQEIDPGVGSQPGA